jgi:predicted acylesterase/phospholipase RssA
MPLGPKHVMASAALPPGFPPVKIGGVAHPEWRHLTDLGHGLRIVDITRPQ